MTKAATSIREMRPVVTMDRRKRNMSDAIGDALREGAFYRRKYRKQHRFCGQIEGPPNRLRALANNLIVQHHTPLNQLRKQGGKAMSSSRTISANGIEFFLREQGEGPLVVLCHGWPEFSYSWRHQIPAIAAAGFHVVAPDMRGFGRTTAPTDVGAYSIFDNVGDMVALVAALGEKRAAIVR